MARHSRAASQRKATGFRQKLAKQTGDARAYACNVTDPVAVAHTFEAIRVDIDQVDVLVYNPGIGVWANVEEIPAEAIEIEARLGSTLLVRTAD